MRIYLSETAAAELSKQAEVFSTSGSLVGRAIIETIIKDGILDEILAGIDLEAFRDRPRKPVGKGMYRFQGQRLSAVGISMITGVSPDTFYDRTRRGIPVEDAAQPKLAKPPKLEANRKPVKTLEYKGQRLTITELGRKVGISPQVIRQRLIRGWSLDLATSVEPGNREKKWSKI